MRASNAMIELAEARVAQETAAGVERVRAQLAGASGRLICDCGEPIPEARRRAVPNTTKCFECACRMERRKRA
jgi:RNA polymerase-binding transcription factor DksA